jgi:beta-galactosidase
MWMERRVFLRTLTAAMVAGSQRMKTFASELSQASSPGIAPSALIETLLEARGIYRPITPSPLHLGGKNPRGESLRFTNRYLDRSGTPTIPVAGEFHFGRFPDQGWEDELRKMKAGGLTVVSTYVFWILHEPIEGPFNWTDRRNLRRFLELCHKVGLEVILRVGPFAHGEMRNGGLPDWLYSKPFAVRSNDPGYLACVERLYGEVGKQTRGLLYEDGGPIIGLQLENEFMAATAPWEVASFHDQPLNWIPSGTGGADHMLRLKQMAIQCGMNPPIFTCTAWGSPVPENECLPVFGGYGFEPWSINSETHQLSPTYSFLFDDPQSKLQPDGKKSGGSDQGTVPFACCELGGGMQCFYAARFIVPPESVQGIAISSLGSGAAFLGYYMFHGGSNPGGEAVFYNEYSVPHISYDFQAPIREYGQIAPSYLMLRPIHLFLQSYGAMLAPMQTVLPKRTGAVTPTDKEAVRCALRTDEYSAFLFLNNYQDHLSLPARENLSFRIALDYGEIHIPESSGISIASGEGAILPIAVSLGPLHLRYATAQLITQLELEETLHVFFFAPRGMIAEFCFDADSAGHCTAPTASIERKGKWVVIRGRDASAFDIVCAPSRGNVVLHILTREDSLRFSMHRLWGQPRVVISDADVAEINGDLVAWSRGNPNVTANVFPPLQASRKSSIRSTAFIPPRVSGLPDDAAMFHSILPAWAGGVIAERASEDSFRITATANALDSVEDVILRVNYCGDIGQAFINGLLVADNFSNGDTWEIGLKYFREQLRDHAILIKVVPHLESSNVVLDSSLLHRERFAGKRVAVIDSVEVMPIYRVLFKANGAMG